MLAAEMGTCTLLVFVQLAFIVLWVQVRTFHVPVATIVHLRPRLPHYALPDTFVPLEQDRQCHAREDTVP